MLTLDIGSEVAPEMMSEQDDGHHQWNLADSVRLDRVQHFGLVLRVQRALQITHVMREDFGMLLAKGWVVVALLCHHLYELVSYRGGVHLECVKCGT